MVKFPMTLHTDHVLQKLFSENSIHNIPLERLRQIVEEYPYFALGHLLLAKKLQSIDAAEYDTQAQKTALYFNEPIWLQSLLHPASEKELVIKERIIEEETIEKQYEEPLHNVEERGVEEAPLHVENLHEQSTEPNEPAVEIVQTEELVIINIDEEQQEPESEQGLENGTQQGEALSQADPEVEHPVRNEQPIGIPSAGFTIEKTSQDTAQIFEPYHTVDYFASQGIKVSNEIKSDDRLSQQLRSFTEWLKTMRRLPETQVETQLDEVTQQNIQEFAAHSLDEKEVVTESMAEVLVKQDRREEAVAIYEKLSLLNPFKRAYFAAKIEQLKGQ
jgi:hypothetical protein